MSESGARPAPGAPKRPGAYPTPATRPFAPGFRVAADSTIGILTGGAGADNNYEDGNKGAKPGNPNPDAHVCTPEGKPSA